MLDLRVVLSVSEASECISTVVFRHRVGSEDVEWATRTDQREELHTFRFIFGVEIFYGGVYDS